jgi:hypothetical protein
MRALGWASVAGLLCLWLTTTTASYDGPASSQPGVAAQTFTSTVQPARQLVDHLALIVPAPVWIAFGRSLPMLAPMALLVVVARRPVNRHTPRAPPVALAR